MAQHSLKKATLWSLDIEAAILTLENNPFRCPLAPENQFFPEEICRLILGKYRILYFVEDEDVHVLYVRHTARDYVQPSKDE